MKLAILWWTVKGARVLAFGGDSDAPAGAWRPPHLAATAHPPCDWFVPPALGAYYVQPQFLGLHHNGAAYFLLYALTRALESYNAWFFDTGSLLGLRRNGLLLPHEVDVDIFVHDLTHVERLLRTHFAKHQYAFGVHRYGGGSPGYAITITLNIGACAHNPHADIFSFATQGAHPHNRDWLNVVRHDTHLFRHSICEYNLLGVGIPLLIRNETDRRLALKYGEGFLTNVENWKAGERTKVVSFCSAF